MSVLSRHNAPTKGLLPRPGCGESTEQSSPAAKILENRYVTIRLTMVLDELQAALQCHMKIFDVCRCNRCNRCYLAART